MTIVETSTTISSLSPYFSLFLRFLLNLLLLLLLSLSLVLSAFWCFLLSSYFSSLSGLLINVYCQIVNIFLEFWFCTVRFKWAVTNAPSCLHSSSFCYFLFLRNHGKCGIVGISLEVLLGLTKKLSERTNQFPPLLKAWSFFFFFFFSENTWLFIVSINLFIGSHLT